MGLFQTLSAANMATQTGLTVRYNINRRTATYMSGDTETEYTYYEYVRTAAKRYKYVGLTKAAALNGAQTKMGKYTRSYSVAVVPAHNATATDVFGAAVTKCTVGIQPVHESGNMWSLEISVDEQDVKTSLSGDLAPGTVFATENLRDYDDGEGAALELEVTDLSFVQPDPEEPGTLTISFGYESSLDGFEPGRMTAEIWTAATAQWVAVKIATLNELHKTGTIEVEGESGDFTNAIVHIAYGPYVSNEESCDPDQEEEA